MDDDQIAEMDVAIDDITIRQNNSEERLTNLEKKVLELEKSISFLQLYNTEKDEHIEQLNKLVAIIAGSEAITALTTCAKVLKHLNKEKEAQNAEN